MIVEFIGCSGAGKTTLMNEVLLRAPGPVVSAWDLTLNRPGFREIANPQLMNIAADALVSLPGWRARRSHETFVSFARESLRACATSKMMRLNYTRSIRRRLGMHAIAVASGPQQTVLADEGTVLIAYLLFVYGGSPRGRSDLERFAELVPRPDMVVHVRAPIETLLARAVERPDRRREFAGLDLASMRRSLERAGAVFDEIASTPQFSGRTLTVENAGERSIDIERIGSDVVAAMGRLQKSRSVQPLEEDR